MIFTHCMILQQNELFIQIKKKLFLRTNYTIKIFLVILKPGVYYKMKVLRTHGQKLSQLFHTSGFIVPAVLLGWQLIVRITLALLRK